MSLSLPSFISIPFYPIYRGEWPLPPVRATHTHTTALGPKPKMTQLPSPASGKAISQGCQLPIHRYTRVTLKLTQSFRLLPIIKNVQSNNYITVCSLHQINVIRPYTHSSTTQKPSSHHHHHHTRIDRAPAGPRYHIRHLCLKQRIPAATQLTSWRHEQAVSLAKRSEIKC